jgi:hypothetical protein
VNDENFIDVACYYSITYFYIKEYFLLNDKERIIIK